MSRARPSINGSDGSNNDLPINTLVQLNNDGDGGEATWTWSITDQPSGTADVLSASSIKNPTFTPKKEGTYRLLLIVDATLPSEVRASVIVGIRELRSNARLPAAGEETEDDVDEGWSLAVDGPMRDAFNLKYAGCLVGALGASMSAQQVVYISGKTTLKSGLPGQEDVPAFAKAVATDAAIVGGRLFVLDSGVRGALTSGQVARARFEGRIAGVALSGTSVNDPIYVSDTALLSKAAGTNSRVVGYVVWTDGTTCDVLITGTPPVRFADAENPAGLLNGSNLVFTLVHAPNPVESLLLVIDGVIQVGTFLMATGPGGAIITMNAGLAPQSTSSFKAWYRW